MFNRNRENVAYVNGDLYTGTTVLSRHALICEGGRIASIVPENKMPRNCRKLDLDGLTLAPGLIDCQVNGGGGVYFNENTSVEGITRIVAAHRKFGVTALLPTIISDTPEVMLAAGNAVREYMQSGSGGVLGIHFEGPFLNPKKAGIHDRKYMVPPTAEHRYAIDKAPGPVRLITLAPEVLDDDFVQYLSRSGWRLLAGHTAASSEEMTQAFSRGVLGVTHLYNAMTGPGSREPGVVSATLLSKTAVASIIVDGMHVHWDSVKVARKCIGAGRLFLVTDAMPPVGNGVASFSIGEHLIRVENGKCVSTDGTLAGSALDLASAVRNSIQKIGIPKDEALRMASTYPANIMGIGHEYGRLEAGYRADFIICNNEIDVKGTVVGGDVVFSGGFPIS